MRMERRLPLSGRSGGSLTAKPGRRPWRGAGHRQERPCTGASCAQIRHAYSRSRNRAYAHVIPAHRGASSGGVLMCGADPGFRVVDAAFAAPGRSGVLAVPVARDRLEARNPPAGASRPPTPDARPRVHGPSASSLRSRLVAGQPPRSPGRPPSKGETRGRHGGRMKAGRLGRTARACPSGPDRSGPGACGPPLVRRALSPGTGAGPEDTAAGARRVPP